jgi:hypothetical protein
MRLKATAGRQKAEGKPLNGDMKSAFGHQEVQAYLGFV